MRHGQHVLEYIACSRASRPPRRAASAPCRGCPGWRRRRSQRSRRSRTPLGRGRVRRFGARRGATAETKKKAGGSLVPKALAARTGRGHRLEHLPEAIVDAAERDDDVHSAANLLSAATSDCARQCGLVRRTSAPPSIGLTRLYAGREKWMVLMFSWTHLGCHGRKADALQLRLNPKGTVLCSVCSSDDELTTVAWWRRGAVDINCQRVAARRAGAAPHPPIRAPPRQTWRR